jgi:hypothetical protein
MNVARSANRYLQEFEMRSSDELDMSWEEAQKVPPYEIWGPDNWRKTVKERGFQGNPERLWDALVRAREQCGSELTAVTIIADLELSKRFPGVVRSLLGETLTYDVLVAALLAMPRECPFCQESCWEWCDECAGCPDCCDFPEHCPNCGGPLATCGHPDCYAAQLAMFMQS